MFTECHGYWLRQATGPVCRPSNKSHILTGVFRLKWQQDGSFIQPKRFIVKPIILYCFLSPIFLFHIVVKTVFFLLSFFPVSIRSSPRIHAYYFVYCICFFPSICFFCLRIPAHSLIQRKFLLSVAWIPVYCLSMASLNLYHSTWKITPNVWTKTPAYGRWLSINNVHGWIDRTLQISNLPKTLYLTYT